ncbi:GCN5 family acetyltransferase, partial [Pseudomonas syringae pv. actinidiae]|nr:GCN5 family acetyltransferase [Pseudomonas syringae pv. actinidiae]
MFDLLRLLNENTPSVIRDMDEWFQDFPDDAAWNVYSDYCVGNPDKANDSFSFVITLNHDTDENFSEYISSVAPKDLKNTRQASGGLISYLNSPVAFSVTFMVERESKLLRRYITDENMIDFTSDMRGLVAQWLNEPGVDITYWQRLDRALAAFSADVGRKGFNSKLARQILLTSSFASFLFVVLNRLKAPARIRWVTDRDATFERYNEISFDIAFMF